ncbi:enoyl-CoA hydratase-related protein [Nocardioides sp. B-3]|uniref:enoyl-CoA hydratase-related protein n=1 Tax=Nocardioides sp. B-3 TaxID=2895565 RepID=UPI00220D1063|nr:enoyl-CoA hydratase-related protein [Nocardioides sp. B-3]
MEKLTGIHIDHYVELGFGSVINTVDAPGGIEICPKTDMDDPKARLDIKKGCQEVDGETALAYSRSRYVSALSDLDRVGRRGEVIGALGSEAKSPRTFLNPVRYWQLTNASAHAIRIDEEMGPISPGPLRPGDDRRQPHVHDAQPVGTQRPQPDHRRPRPRTGRLQGDHRGRRRSEEPLHTDRTSPLVTFETLTVETDVDGVTLLTLSRPEAMNSFTVTMARELEAFFPAAAEDDTIRAIVVTGSGKAFCAGMDLSADGNVFGLDESVSPTPASLREHLTEEPFQSGVRDTGGKVTLAIHACPKPVIAAINGAAVGIGATMTLAMDIRLASTRARIGFVFGRLGIVPEACSSWFLPRIVGTQQALEWVYSADILTAEQALAGSLLSKLHEPDDPVPAALELARSFVVDRSLL